MDRDFLVGVLLRCALYGFALLLIWFAMYVFAGDWMHRIHRMRFDITAHEFAVINYCGMGLLKLFVLLVYVFPYLAIRFTASSSVGKPPKADEA